MNSRNRRNENAPESDENSGKTINVDMFYGHGPCFPTSFDKAARGELSPSEPRYFRAMLLHYRDTRNAYIALEAFVKMVERQISPPIWVLDALAEGFAKHLEDPDPKKLSSVTNLTGHEYTRYRQRKKRSDAMIDFVKLIGPDFELGKAKAAELVDLKHDTGIEPKTLVNEYDKQWLQFYDELDMLPVEKMDDIDRDQFVKSFPEIAQRHLSKVPTKS